MFDNAILIAAHPDDEILWFSSVIGSVQRVIVAHLRNRNPIVTEGRRRSISCHPLTQFMCLGLSEAGTFALSRRRPKITRYGVELRCPLVDATYRQNYDRLLDLLRPLVADCENVYTHGPWGEYGHPDHIQIYRAVSQLQKEHAFSLWFSNYVSNRASGLRAALAPSIPVARSVLLPTDLATAHMLERLYTQNHCWTWYQSYRWPQFEQLICQGPRSAGSAWAADFLPISLDRRLGMLDRLRWWKAALRKILTNTPLMRLFPLFAR
jgi:LmbE family N-acetylglucosaminyl deacetylase